MMPSTRVLRKGIGIKGYVDSNGCGLHGDSKKSE